jgi:hypothetical protein
LCWQIPKLFSAVLGGAPALTGGDLLSTATGLVAGAAAVGSLAAGGAALAARGAAALSGVGAAAGAGRSGARAGSTAASIGSASLGGGAAGGGTVPPPSSPSSGPSGNGGPKQPSPPSRNGGARSGSVDLAAVGSNSNGSARYQTSNGNGSSRSSALASVGGDDLAGSGFENERPASAFPSASTRIVSTSPARSGFAGSATTSMDSTSSVLPPAGNVSAGSPATRPTEGNAPAPATAEPAQGTVGSPPGVASDIRSVGSASTRAQQPPQTSRRERLASAARRTDQVFSRAAGRLRGIRNQLGGLPSDAAPHTPPPRMPVDHHE